MDLDRVEHILLCEQQFGLFDGVPDEDLPKRFPNEHGYYQMQCRFGGKFWARMPQRREPVRCREADPPSVQRTFHRDALEHGIREDRRDLSPASRCARS